MKPLKTHKRSWAKSAEKNPFFNEKGKASSLTGPLRNGKPFFTPISNMIQAQKGPKKPSRKTLKVIGKQARKKPKNFIHLDQPELTRRFKKDYAEAVKTDAQWQKSFGKTFYRHKNARTRSVLYHLIAGVEIEFTSLIRRKIKDIAKMEKQLKGLNAALIKLKGSLVLTADERRGGEPPHPPYGQIQATQRKISALKGDLSAARWSKDLTLKQASKASITIQNWLQKHPYPYAFSPKRFKRTIEFFSGQKLP